MTNKLLLLIGVIFFLSCDFTPPLNKEILQAQKHIIDRDYLAATKKYKEILKKNPPIEIQVKVNYQLGDLYSIYLSDNRESLKYYKKIMSISSKPLWLVKTQERIAEIYFSYIKDFEKSANIYKKLSSFKPKLTKQDFYSYRYAISIFNRSFYNQAKDLFTDISNNKLNEYYDRSFYYLGLINFQKKDYLKAIENWKSYIKEETRRDNIIQAKFLMANAYETMEELKIAYNLYYSILGEYPNTSVIKNRLKGIYERRVARKR